MWHIPRPNDSYFAWVHFCDSFDVSYLQLFLSKVISHHFEISAMCNIIIAIIIIVVIVIIIIIIIIIFVIFWPIYYMN